MNSATEAPTEVPIQPPVETPNQNPHQRSGGQGSTSYIPFYNVLLHNDDVNTMEHVLGTLQQVFGWGQGKAYKIMMEAHNTGVAHCITVNFEAAEHFRDQLQSFSLSATLEAV